MSNREEQLERIQGDINKIRYDIKRLQRMEQQDDFVPVNKKKVPFVELCTIVVSIYWSFFLFSHPHIFDNSKALAKTLGYYSEASYWASAFVIAVCLIGVGYFSKNLWMRKVGLTIQFFLFCVVASGWYIDHDGVTIEVIIYLIFAFQSLWGLREVGVRDV